MLKSIALAFLAAVSAFGWFTSRPTAPQPASAMQDPVRVPERTLGGPVFALPAPAGFPASFNVSYAGSDGAFATTAYFTGFSGEVMRWVSVPVSYTAVATNYATTPPTTGPVTVGGPVVISYHTGLKMWCVEVEVPPAPGNLFFVSAPGKNTGLMFTPQSASQFGVGVLTVR